MLKATKAFVANCIKIINIFLRIDVPLNDIKKLARPRVNSSMSEWSVSLKEVSRRADDNDYDDDDDDDNEDASYLFTCACLF